ncbi:MAG: glycerophosphodiester phosphodiesterase family protein, partial [Actinomycetota bacterium]
GRIERVVIELSKRYRFTAMSFSLLAVMRFKRELSDVAYVVAHRWRLIYLPTRKVAIDVELFAKSRWTRKRLIGREVLLWTVNDENHFQQISDLKVAGVITDRPDLPFRS